MGCWPDGGRRKTLDPVWGEAVRLGLADGQDLAQAFRDGDAAATRLVFEARRGRDA